MGFQIQKQQHHIVWRAHTVADSHKQADCLPQCTEQTLQRSGVKALWGRIAQQHLIIIYKLQVIYHLSLRVTISPSDSERWLITRTICNSAVSCHVYVQNLSPDACGCSDWGEGNSRLVYKTHIMPETVRPCRAAAARWVKLRMIWIFCFWNCGLKSRRFQWQNTELEPTAACQWRRHRLQDLLGGCVLSPLLHIFCKRCILKLAERSAIISPSCQQKWAWPAHR